MLANTSGIHRYSYGLFSRRVPTGVSLIGYPSKIFSDPGSQLTAASKELKVMFNEVDWSKIKMDLNGHFLQQNHLGITGVAKPSIGKKGNLSCYGRVKINICRDVN